MTKPKCSDCGGDMIFDEQKVVAWLEKHGERMAKEGMTPEEAQMAIMALIAFGSMMDELEMTHPHGRLVRVMLAAAATQTMEIERSKHKRSHLEKCLKH